MGKDQELLQVVRDQDISSLQRILNRTKVGKSKIHVIGSSKRLNVNFQDQDGMSALHQASLVGHLEMMKLLLDSGAAVDLKDTKGMRPLHYASWQGHERPVQLLLECKSSPNQPANDGVTPLHLACEHGHYNVVNSLLKFHADPTVFNHHHRTPLDLSCEFGKLRVVELLLCSNLCNRALVAGPDDMVDNNRTTCLHLAAKNGHSNVIKLLLQAGMDINRQTRQGTCLHEAALCGKIDVVKLLLDCGVNVNKTNALDQTALDIVNQFTANRAAKELKQLLKEAAYALQARATGNYYNPQEPNHLAFKESDLITVLEQHPSGMWKGYVSTDPNRVTGYFPSSMVVLVDSHSVTRPSCQLSGSAIKVSSPQVPDLIMRGQYHSHQHLHQNGGPAYSSIGADESFPPPPSPLVSHKTDYRDPDRDSGISPQQSYPSHPFPGTQGYPGRQPSPNSPGERTAEWVGRYVVDGDARSHSPGSSKDGCSPGSSNRNSIASTNSGGYLSPNYVNLQITQQHRLSGQSYESGVSGVSGVSSSASRQSYHSTSSSSLGSLDRLEESGYSSTINVHELFQAGVSDEDILRAWLGDLHFDEYEPLFVKAGYDMPTISHMTPQDLSAIGITKPSHRKKLKAEISRLHIQDGIPDHKPGDIGEWLHLLNLGEYYGTLIKQGYANIDDVTDITWEDLEEVGIQRLGHQKKIMLAIDRLRRIQSGARRLSHLDRHASQEVLEPPSAFPTPRWLTEKSGIPPPSPGNPGTPVKVVRSTSGENLCGVSSPELRSFSQPPVLQNGPTDFVHLHSSSKKAASGRYQPDVVAIQVSKTPNARGSTVPEDMVAEEECASQPTYQSFYSPITKSTDRLDGDVTPTNEMGGLSGDETDGSSTLKKTALVIPRVKPKPLIMAKTKRMSRELPADFLKPESFDSPGSLAYSTATLPRKSSKKKLERIYDQPTADFMNTFESYLQQSANRNSAPSSPAHSASLQNASPKPKKAPPPPPKRTNSIKNESGAGRMFRREGSVTSSHNSLPATPPAAALTAAAPDMAAPASAPAAVNVKPGFSSCVKSLADRFNKQEPTTTTTTTTTTTRSSAQITRTPDSEEFPPPPPPLDASGEVFTDYNGLNSTNPLNDVIEQLEHASASHKHQQGHQHTNQPPPQQHQHQHQPPQQHQPPHNTGTKPKQKVTDSKPSDSSNRGDATATTVPTVRRNESSSSLESSASASSLESNTLPFANENVGTIKQRNPSTKTSIVTVSIDGEGDGDKNVDLNASLFDEEETGTMKRNPKASQSADGGSKKAPPPAPKRRDSNSGNLQQQNTAAAAAAAAATPSAQRPAGKAGEPGDVLNDIGNMLQDLTDELDAMLELELE